MFKGTLKKLLMIALMATIVISGVLIGSYEVKARELEETKPGEHGNCGAVNGDVMSGGIMLNTIIETRYAEIYYTFNNGILTIDGTDIDIAIYDHDYARYHVMWEGYFENCTNIKEVVINLEYICIGKNAFKGCTNLTKVTMPKIYYDIGSSAFEGCTSLESVIFPDGCHPENSGISRNVFKDCTSLTSITLPSRYTQILSGAFEGCTSLTSITVPRQISQGAFRGCTNLKTVIFDEVCFIIPGIRFNNQNEVEEYAVSEGNDIFYGCDNISTIIINKEYDFSRFVTEGRTNEDINSLYIKTMINSVRRNSPNVSTITIPTKYVKTIQDLYTENGEDIRIGAFTVTFDENGHGTAPEKQENILCYDKISAPEEPIASGCTFEGWYKEAECVNPWDFDTEMTDDITLYAKWTEHHGPVSEWSKMSDGHWHECVVEGCTEIFDEEAHDYPTDDTCSACGYDRNHVHRWDEGNWAKDSSSHWHACSGCSEKKDLESHNWNEGVVTKEPTVDEEGIKTYTCTVCNETKTKPIDKKEPDKKEPDKKEPEKNEPEKKEPEIKEPEKNEPEIKEPEKNEPEKNEPEKKEPEIKEPEKNEPQDNDKTDEKSDEKIVSSGIPKGPSKSIYDEKMDALIKELELASDEAKKTGTIKTIYLKDITSLSLSAMKTLKNNPNVILDMTYTYNGVNFHVVIPGGLLVYTNESIPWYGPVWLYTYYGQGALTNASGSTSNVYVVQSGDTLRKIAAKLSVSLDYLIKKNPQIKNVDKLSIGDKVNY